VVAGDLKSCYQRMDWKILWPNQKAKKLKTKFHWRTNNANFKSNLPRSKYSDSMLVASYRTPSMKTRDARVLDFISSYLSDGKSSKLYKSGRR
jgi:predicted Zn-dependent peptidase